MQGDALRLPFRAGTFGCLLAAHFYGHLDRPLRARFLTEARRVAERILVVDAAWREGVQPEEVQERVLTDGSRHQVYKRYFTPAQLTAEIGGGRVVACGAVVCGCTVVKAMVSSYPCASLDSPTRRYDRRTLPWRGRS